ncbi:hypothetical protein GCM10025876_14090 [Demequina litorisediminis]|uniref:Uncharacterized protein n=1 Tax=Demequina litorisediminis TaxID=1849022 RepID=A0ABQ6ICW9_9MICO|nr:hypothetical protein GCM10025876_14090 [Demequina litorisediminis]
MRVECGELSLRLACVPRVVVVEKRHRVCVRRLDAPLTRRGTARGPLGFDQFVRQSVQHDLDLTAEFWPVVHDHRAARHGLCAHRLDSTAQFRPPGGGDDGGDTDGHDAPTRVRRDAIIQTSRNGSTR